MSYYRFGEGEKYKISSKPWIPSEFEKNFWCGDVQAVLRGSLETVPLRASESREALLKDETCCYETEERRQS